MSQTPDNGGTALQPPGLAAASGRLIGLRVLVVEDVTILAWMAETLLRSFGCEVEGPAATAGGALALIRTRPVDIAMLDISLRKGDSFLVADLLVEKKIPFVFVSAHGRGRILPEHAAAPLIQKPYSPLLLQAGLLQALGLPAAA